MFNYVHTLPFINNFSTLGVKIPLRFKPTQPLTLSWERGTIVAYFFIPYRKHFNDAPNITWRHLQCSNNVKILLKTSVTGLNIDFLNIPDQAMCRKKNGGGDGVLNIWLNLFVFDCFEVYMSPHTNIQK